MAYNPYYPMGYQPYNATPYYPVQTQPIQTPAVVTQTQTSNSIVWVAGERQAIDYPVAPNNAVALWDSNAPVIYLKTADASGKPTLKAYELVERSQTHENGSVSQNNASVDQIPDNDLSFVKTALNAIQSDLSKIMKSVKAEDNE